MVVGGGREVAYGFVELFLITCHLGRELLGRGRWSPGCDGPWAPREPVGQSRCLISALGGCIHKGPEGNETVGGGSGGFKEGLFAEVWVGWGMGSRP